jgi:hypothetical protein
LAGDWIKLETTTPDKPEVHTMASALGIEPEHVLGCLCRIWIWADQQSLDGNALSVTETLLDRVTRVPGFAVAMRECGWLTGKDGSISLPNFDHHNGKTAKSRALTARRAVTHRSRLSNDAGVTNALPREEKRRSKPLTPFLLPEWVPQNAWIAFEEMRLKNRKPMTDRARELVVKELENLKAKGNEPSAVLEQSVRNGWQDVFPLRNPPAKKASPVDPHNLATPV